MLTAGDQAVRRGIGVRLRELRTERRLSQEGVAERAGIACKYVGEIERGETNPSVTILVRLARGLGVPVAELFRRITPDSSADPCRAAMWRAACDDDAGEE